MTFRIRPEHCPVDEIRRVIHDELTHALDAVARVELRNCGPTVHLVRKRTKRVRSALRLLEPGLRRSVFRRENRVLRDAARALAWRRDLDARVEAVRGLLMHAHLGPGLPPDLDDRLYVHVIGDRRERDLTADLHAFAAAIEAVHARLPSWSIEGDGLEVIHAGATRTYRRARRRMREADAHRRGSRFHRWRTSVKIHGHHCRLLAAVTQSELAPRPHAVGELAEALGDEHDLGMLRDTLRGKPAVFGDADVQQTLREAIHERRSELRSFALARGKELFADRPRAYRKRL